jgi:thioredoxin 2
MAEARQISGSEQLEAELAKEQPCVVEFWMVGCPACARMAPSFGDLAEELASRANLVGLEARDNMELSRKYAIRGVPTVVVFRGGEEVQRSTGAKSIEELRSWLEPALV